MIKLKSLYALHFTAFPATEGQGSRMGSTCVNRRCSFLFKEGGNRNVKSSLVRGKAIKGLLEDRGYSRGL